jgi:hypothetical protein
MQELILVISRCVSKRKSTKEGTPYYIFHFKGYYFGEKIKEIHLYLAGIDFFDEQLSKGDDYFLWAKRKSICQGILEVELIKYKKIM